MKSREDAIKGRDAELGELAKAQAAERNRLEELERKMRVKEADLDAKARVLAEDRAAFSLLEERSRVALKTLYEKVLERPLTTNEDGPGQLLPFLVKALEEVVEGIGPMAEAEARELSSAALTWVFNHLHLCDPSARLDELLEPVADEHCAAAAEAVKGQVERDFWNEQDPGDLDPTSSNQQGGHEVGGTPTPQARPPPSWAPCCSTDVLLPPIYTYYPQTTRYGAKTLIPPP